MKDAVGKELLTSKFMIATLLAVIVYRRKRIM